MRQVYFDDIASYDDLGLILISAGISMPAAKRTTVDIPGADGLLDLSFLPVRFENRKLSFVFKTKTSIDDWERLRSSVSHALHGKNRKVVLDSDKEWYWDAFVLVNGITCNVRSGTVQIDCDADPYKHKDMEFAEVETAVSGTRIICPNAEQAISPTIKTSATITVAYGSGEHTLNAGTHKVNAIKFAEGDNELLIKGRATVTVTYRQGKL